MVAAKKKNTGELRICFDPRDLNKALMRPHHPLKTVEEVASTIPNATVFSILDGKSAFWHIPLDNKSSYICTTQPLARFLVAIDTYACPMALLPLARYISKQ